MPSKWDEMQRLLGIEFSNPSLLKQAFTHASYRNEHRKSSEQDNERLEFLGDAVLELSVSEHLFKTFPNLPEGELTRLRAALVCEPALVRCAKRLDFERFIRLGKGEEKSGGRNRPALLADVFEAFIGALYLDQGLEAANRFVHQHVLDALAGAATAADYKTALQEWVQKHISADLRYVIAEERGPAHAREFVVEVRVGAEIMGNGSGKSKKEAEQNAAREALVRLTTITRASSESLAGDTWQDIITHPEP